MCVPVYVLALYSTQIIYVYLCMYEPYILHRLYMCVPVCMSPIFYTDYICVHVYVWVVYSTQIIYVCVCMDPILYTDYIHMYVYV